LVSDVISRLIDYDGAKVPMFYCLDIKLLRFNSAAAKFLCDNVIRVFALLVYGPLGPPTEHQMAKIAPVHYSVNSKA